MAPSAPPLTREEFVSLRDGAKGLMHRIPPEHKARLIELGYIEEVSGGIRLSAFERVNPISFTRESLTQPGRESGMAFWGRGFCNQIRLLIPRQTEFIFQLSMVGEP
jgi:hypothetical protein